jgi:hypothetical protein
VAAWLESPTLSVLGEGPEHWTDLADLLRSSGVAGPPIHDVRVVAICLAHGVSTFWSLDRDFSRFPRLSVLDPLACGEASPRSPTSCAAKCCDSDIKPRMMLSFQSAG